MLVICLTPFGGFPLEEEQNAKNKSFAGPTDPLALPGPLPFPPLTVISHDAGLLSVLNRVSVTGLRPGKPYWALHSEVGGGWVGGWVVIGL